MVGTARHGGTGSTATEQQRRRVVWWIAAPMAARPHLPLKFLDVLLEASTMPFLNCRDDVLSDALHQLGVSVLSRERLATVLGLQQGKGGKEGMCTENLTLPP